MLFHPNLKIRLPLLFLCGAMTAMAAPPDLTNGGVPGDAISFNMGATGARGWAYHTREDTSESRQILVMSVAAGSPADGILAANDVILGANGTGATAVNFTSDARKSLGLVIGAAEARDPAILSLIRWRAGVTSTVTLTLRTMGAYSSTAPYNCPKSAKILKEGLQYIMTNNETAGNYSFGTLSLLAANDPADPDNAARMARAQTEARALVPSAATMTQMMSSVRETASGWQRGHTLIVLAEYFLATNDTYVLPAIEAYAVNIARNQSLFGTLGHIFAEKNPDGSDNGPMGGVYGPVNSSGMPCFLGLLLARECDLTQPVFQSITKGYVDAAIERTSRFFAYYAGRGAVPYGEHEPFWQAHENNGKSGLAALCFELQGNRATEGKFFSKMAAASASQRGDGHTGAFFNYVWAPLGAAAGGEEAAASHFSRISWMLDLNRRWDGAFDYDCLSGEGPNSGSQYNSFRMSTAALLTYALPLRKLHVTGCGHDPARHLTSADVAEAAAVDGYVATSSRTISQLIADLGSWSPMVQRRAAEQLATRTIDTATLNQITALANDPNGNSRIGACYTLGKISNSSTANARAATLAALLTDPKNQVRFIAAESLRYLPDSARLSQLNAILSAAASTATPLLPFDEEDPLHFAHGRLAMLLFYSGSAYGPKGVIYGNKINSPTVINRSLLYPAIRAIAANPVGQARSTLGETYKYLTAADVNALADTLVESINFRAPSDKMFSSGIRQGGLTVLEKYNNAEGVPLSIRFMVDDGRGDSYTSALGTLQSYAGSCNTVQPDPDVVGFCKALLSSSNAAAAQAVLDAIAADTNPVVLTPFKSIQSVTANASSITLPANQTILHANATDLANGNPVYTWRKVHGAGDVTFTPNGTAAAKDATVSISNVPGKYRFEVTMSDSRGFTEVRNSLLVTLYESNGTLPSNNPPVANPHAVNAITANATAITLTGSDPEGYPLVFSITSPPAHGSLAGTAPALSYTSDVGYIGSDSFTFQAMDSEGQTASATVSITVGTAGVRLLAHEPFDYAAGALNGKGGASEIGFTGTWNASASAQVVAGSLSYGTLPTLGGSIGNLNGGSNNYGGSRTLSASSLAESGFLDNGATLWFGVVVGYGAGGNVTNSRLAFALANHNFSSGNYQYYILNQSPQLGSGLGLTLGRFNGTNGKVVATQFRDSSYGTSGFDFNVFGNVPPSIIGGGQQRLVVGKITWGAASDTIELYEPDASLNLNLPTSTLTVNVDQSTFDTITWARGDVVTMDEIRFGNSYAAVIGVQGPSPDTTPPALSNIVDDRSAEPVAQNTPVNYTVTFSEEMDAATITASDFGNAGSAVVTIGSIIHPTPGVFLIPVTPTTAGSLQLRINAGAVLKDIAGNSLDTSTAITDETVITVNPQMVLVPNVVGLPQTTAGSDITSAGLSVGANTQEYDSNAPAGSIISQNPAAETTVSIGSTVNLVISKGPHPDYETWQTLYPGKDLTDSAADPDHDGLTNGEERLWGLDPTNPASANPYVAAFNPQNGTFTYSRRDPVLTGYNYTVMTSPDLSVWSEDTGVQQSAGATNANGVQPVVVTLSSGKLGSGRLFVRVRAVKTQAAP